ncbi:MAG: EF-hand domain-containing protein [Desulfovibrionaceae bacterium]
MSVSSVTESTSGLNSELLAQLRQARGSESEEFASNIINDKDQDEDGLLSLEEAGIGEDHFATADADGDGYLSGEEIQADLENRKEQADLMGKLNMLMQGVDTGTLVDSLIAEMDADGDSMIGLEESGLEEDLFNALDADNDGLLSSDDLTSALSGTADQGSSFVASAYAGAVSAGSGEETGEAEESSASSDSGEEEFDEYDFNEDGTVTLDELRQAFMNGDLSLSELFEDGGGEGGTQNALMRLAMSAYGAQAGEMGEMGEASMGAIA